MTRGSTPAGETSAGRGSPPSHAAGVKHVFAVCFAGIDNDPSAGSPTETLLRLLLPLNDKLFVFHKSKNFTSDYEIRMPTAVPVNHYSDPEGQLTAPEARPGQLRPGAHRRQKGRDDRCTP
ncbi:hypothetical protein SASPL_155792 [Salvia splendens]|uniref:Uncharacterized protein n=1 Tax=Salvia splendens TaxID=180675 RepID=A0A8X8VXR2_SALSN|nr:hypothetical protein SASPL_155792 [Salvia splendens]